VVTDYELEIRAAITSAYYSRLVSHADTMRTRAQGAYATVSTLAGGLIGIGLLTNLAQLTLLVRLLGLIATTAWAAAAAGFVVAAATSVKLGGRASQQETSDRSALEFVEHIIDEALEEQRRVRLRLRVALGLGATAALATVATVMAAVGQYPSNSARGVRLQLTPAGVDLLAAQCGVPSSSEAVVDVRGLTSASAFLDIDVAEGPGQGCRVLLPRTSAVGFMLR
jgi:hypothetical protein